MPERPPDTLRAYNKRARAVLAATVVLCALTACHRTQSVQRGYRGQNSAELYSESTLAKLDEVNKYPKPLKKAGTVGPKAGETLQNVQVLGDLTTQQLARVMVSIKTWVAPKEGCGYCHNAPDYASDAKYTKRIAREMLRMTRHINTDWTKHVAATGVTCFTCHRGKPIPAAIWFSSPDRQYSGEFVVKASMRPPTPAAAATALPNDPLTDYLLHDDPIRIVGTTALAAGNRHSVLQAKNTYSLMMVMAESLGVNCTFCHSTRAFYAWDQSTPQRATAWYGIRMVRDLNSTVMLPLATLLPHDRMGPTGDVPKIYCATCHRGTNKPLYGAPMIKDYPELVSPPLPIPAQNSPAAAAPPLASNTTPR